MQFIEAAVNRSRTVIGVLLLLFISGTVTYINIPKEAEPDVDIPFIFVSGALGEEAAIEALTRGATDYVLKHNLSRLAPAVLRALKEVRNRRKRRQAQKALQRYNEMLRTIMEATPVGIVGLDLDGHVHSVWNSAAAKMLGYDRRRDLIGMKTAECYTDIKQREVVRKELEANDYIEDFEITSKKRDGKKLNFLVSITIQRNDNGDYIRSVAFFRDITKKSRSDAKRVDPDKK